MKYIVFFFTRIIVLTLNNSFQRGHLEQSLPHTGPLIFSFFFYHVTSFFMVQFDWRECDSWW